MNTNTLPSNRFNDIVARQRSSRLRDLTFSILLAVGIALSLGALRSAASHSSAPLAAAPSCHVAQSC